MAACTDTSSAEVGSSHTTISGRGEGAGDRHPLLEPAGKLARAAAAGGGPPAGPRRSARPAGRAAPAPDSPASRVSGRLIRLRTVCRRLSAESGFWNTICSARSVSRGRRRASGPSGAPSSVTTEPGSGAVSPSSTRASVVLPLPDSPTSPSVSPVAHATGRRPASAWTPPGEGLGQSLDEHSGCRRLRRRLARQRRPGWRAAGPAPPRGRSSARSAPVPRSKNGGGRTPGSDPGRARTAARRRSRSVV